MNIKILKALAVLKLILTFYTKNKAKLDAKASLKQNFEKLQAIVDYIESLLPEKYKDHTATTNLKNEWKTKLVFWTLKIDNLLYVYHKNEGDQELMKNFKSSKSSLIRKRDLELAVYAQELQNYYETLSPEQQQSIGLEESMLDSLKECVTNYTNYLPKAHALINLNVKSGEKIILKIEKANAIIRDLKRLIFSFFAKDGSDIYQDFLVSAKMKPSVVIKRAVIGKIMDTDGDIPKRPHVIIRNENINQVVTSKQGNFVIKHLPPGVYVLEIVCDNYESQLHTISHVAGETNRLNVKLKRITEVEVAES